MPARGLPVIDIPILILVGRHIARIVQRKNRSPRRYVWLLILAWYGGASLGGYSAGVIDKTAGIGASKQNPPVVLICGAILGALAGLVVTYMVVRASRPADQEGAEFEDYEDNERSVSSSDSGKDSE